MTPEIKNFGKAFAHFGGFEESFLTILRVKKVVYFFFKVLQLFRTV